MPRKTPVRQGHEQSDRPVSIPPAKISPKKAKLSRSDRPDSTQSELMRITLRACLIARDATFNMQDLLTTSSRMAFLVMSVAHRVQARSGQIPGGDVRYLVQMSVIVREMLEDIHNGFVSLDVEKARKVLRTDAELDRICHTLFQHHLADNVHERDSLGFDVLLMAQALERSGDHAKNLAEELYGLIEGHTLRHSPKRTIAL